MFCQSQNVTLDAYAGIVNDNLTLEAFQLLLDEGIDKNESPFGPNLPTITTVAIIKNRPDLVSALMQSNSTSFDSE